ncbi:3-deoxy-D-manno-octulosonic acid transferase [Desulfolithobacter dissulfuricans]|uniref:3-deoxy-D-manno-octulosonic acid transferase n=1 Tax=Desulfolithobacter dissulfuricans TaxID=2795293 RepID=UPI0022798DCF|nr:glycosyltransferase N-terminal domain-containing protein [Desulfolithobacter dissulfuricans]
MRREFPEAVLVVSVTTRTGMELAAERLEGIVNHLLYSPFDLPPVVSRFIGRLQPDLFILVETDFWPNWLLGLRQKQIPSLLVNGRISQASFRRYQRLAWFFRPMFQSFTRLSLQSASDRSRCLELGIAADAIRILGNLKYDTGLPDNRRVAPSREKTGLDHQARIWLCGSTHRGEEETLLRVALELKSEIPDLVLVLAPRDVNRREELVRLAQKLGCKPVLRSRWLQEPGNRDRIDMLLLLDTIGELAGWYQLADLAFIGGSLVPEGGHNPLEAATCSVPVLFGPHMDDFTDIAAEMLACGGARTVHSGEEMLGLARDILNRPDQHQAMQRAQQQLIAKHSEVTTRHIEEIKALLHQSGS